MYVGDILAVERDGSAGRFEQSNQHPPQGCLPTTGFAYQADCLAPEDVEVDTGDRVDGANVAL